MNFSNKFFISVLFLCFFPGCISSVFKEKIPPFSKAVSYKSPQKPFSSVGNSSYPSWKNKETNNVILIISNCEQNITSPELAYNILSENIESVKVSDLSIQPTLISKIKTKTSARSLNGYLDDEAISIKTFSFKYKDCIYISALSGKPSMIEKDNENWKSFLSSIELK